jgi:hypothetical protein
MVPAAGSFEALYIAQKGLEIKELLRRPQDAHENSDNNRLRSSSVFDESRRESSGSPA